MTTRYRVYRNISCLVTNLGIAGKRGIRPQEEDLGLISNAALVYDSKKGTLWVGHDKNLPKNFRAKPWKHFNCKSLVAYPGLVDSHTHLAFSGDRSREFILRMQGASYQKIAEAGGGILSSMRATRDISVSAMTEKIAARLQVAHGFGVRLLEAKSGYGLTPESEIKSLEALQNAQKKMPLVQVQGTCLSAHAIPPEFKTDPDKYVSLICEKILPAVKKKRLAQYVDVFCDNGYFSIEQTKKIFSTARTLGLELRLHGEELAHTGAAELAVEFGARSVDHLLRVSDMGIKALAQSPTTVATLLPGTAFYLKEAPAPARKLIDAGACVALATDFNPGTCPTQNLPFIGTLAAIQLGMSSAEIIAGITWNAAKSMMGENSFGALLPGFMGEPIFCEGDHPAALFYQMAQPALPEPHLL